MSNFGETLDLDQIEGAEFEFLGPEMRFERNKKSQILKFEWKFEARNRNSGLAKLDCASQKVVS